MLLNINNGTKSFNKQLISFIKTQNNDEALSMLQFHDFKTLTDDSGATLLHYAAESNNAVMTKFFVDSKIDVNARNKLGKTPLMLSLSKCTNIPVVKVLLEAKADIFVTNKSGKNAVEMVFGKKQCVKREIIEMFFKSAWSEHEDDRNVVAQKLANAKFSLYHVVQLQNVEVTRIFLKSGVPLDLRDPKYGNTALHMAVSLLDLENVKVLLEQGADVNAKNNSKETPLSLCAKAYINGTMDESSKSIPNQEIVKILIDHGASLLNDEGILIVRGILTSGTRESINILVEQCNLNLHAKDSDGYTVPHYILENENPDVYRELFGKYFDLNTRNNNEQSALFSAIKSENFNAVQFLLDKGANVNIQSTSTSVPIYMAFPQMNCSEEYKKIMILLMHHKVDLHKSIPPMSGFGERFISDWFRDAEMEKLAFHYFAIISERENYNVIPHWSEMIGRKYYQVLLLNMSLMRELIFRFTTIYDLLYTSEERILEYAQNDLFMLELHEVCKKNIFYGLAKMRVEEIVMKKKMKEETFPTILEIIGPYFPYYIVKEIASYFDISDMRALMRSL